MRSISSNGPIGKPAARIARSIDSTEPSPASSIWSASSVNGRFTRLTMKPGASAERTAIFPQPVTSRVAASTTPGSASGGATTSTSGMTGAGLKKWRPTTRSGRAVAVAIAAIDSALVFEARIASGGAAASSAAKTAA